MFCSLHHTGNIATSRPDNLPDNGYTLMTNSISSDGQRMGTVIDYRPRKRSLPKTTDQKIGSASIELADAMDCYPKWPRPTAIVVDGPYGLGKFPGDPHSSDELAEWYAPHVAEWTKHAIPETTLWFWCSEVGWAEVHPVLKMGNYHLD